MLALPEQVSERGGRRLLQEGTDDAAFGGEGASCVDVVKEATYSKIGNGVTDAFKREEIASATLFRSLSRAIA